MGEFRPRLAASVNQPAEEAPSAMMMLGAVMLVMLLTRMRAPVCPVVEGNLSGDILRGTLNHICIRQVRGNHFIHCGPVGDAAEIAVIYVEVSADFAGTAI